MAIATVKSKPYLSNPVRESRKALWTGRILSGLVAAFMAMDGTVKVLELPVAVEGTVKLGYPQAIIFWAGLWLRDRNLRAVLPFGDANPKTWRWMRKF